jgi:hypothetical protein
VLFAAWGERPTPSDAPCSAEAGDTCPRGDGATIPFPAWRGLAQGRAAVDLQSNANGVRPRQHAFTMNRPLAALSLLAAASSVAIAQDTRRVTGEVRDSAGRRIAHANVTAGKDIQVVADDSGRFRYEVPNRKAQTVNVRRIGFEPVELKLPEGGDTTLVVTLAPLPQRLQRMIVEAERTQMRLERRGFYARMADHEKGIIVGHFITPEEIEQRKPYRITQLFEGRSGIRLRRVGGSGNDVTPVGLDGCNMTVYLDDVRLNSQARANNAVTDLDTMIGSNSVAGMEVYTSGVRAPQKYATNASSCGVILIWTK